jgi:transposase
MINDQKNKDGVSFSACENASDLSSIVKENKSLKHRVVCLKEENDFLREQLQLKRDKKFGVSSEKHQYLQFDLFTDEAELDALNEETSIINVNVASHERKVKTNGRNIDTSKLPREQRIHDFPENEKCCTGCGENLEKFGEDRSEHLEFIPARLLVIEDIRPKYTCRNCEIVKSAPAPERPIAKCMAGSGLITEVIISKYHRHLPMYRQSKIWEAEGIKIPRNTLVNWALKAFDALAPIAEALWEQLASTHVLQADETRVKMLETNKQGFMWCYHSCDPGKRYVLYAYHDGRGAAVAEQDLSKFRGILQTDGYAGYNSIREKNNLVTVGCMAHCRRKFQEVIKMSDNKSGKAHYAYNEIGKLYGIEQEIKGKSFAERYAIRQEKSKPILEKMREWSEKSIRQVPPQSNLGKALGYMTNQWDSLIEYINHGEVEIDNNWVENKIRPFALGRKNWMFVGSQRGADAASLFYSLIQTCIMNEIDPRKYFVYVLDRSHEMRRKQIDAVTLLPQNIDRSKL